MTSVSTVLALMLASIAAPAFAQEATTFGREVAEQTFASIDEEGRGYIHMGDMERFRAGMFAGMDYDNDLKVTFAEFSAWDTGFGEVAEEEGRPDAFITATKIVFSFWDRNADFVLTDGEMRSSINADFQRADIDDDGLLSQEEFLQSFGIIVAFRAAIRPDIDFRAD
ncbi:MAG: hypothetical protein RIB53_09650 [Roseitalea porphyridii]|uniref:hypothetical protein n=1 Tax=Roseitalea porphyridii TaxID=1852022 RepID=UPI0032EE1BDF